jgi:pimeloyl-ACP methyl ester carboxylesterase
MTDTIVMTHGMWGGGWYWSKFRSFFEARGYRCVTPTLRYHDVDPTAPPDPNLGTTSLLDYVRDLEEEIASLGTDPILMGHSMGGLLSAIVASRGLGRALVQLNPAPPRGVFALRPSVMRSFRSALTTWGFWRKPFRQTFEEAAYSMLHLFSPEEQRDAYARFVHESGRAASEAGFWLFDRHKASQVIEQRVRCPVLVVAGVEDRITPVAVTRQIAARYGPHCTYWEFPGHAHWTVGETGWQDIATYIAEWLRDVLPLG